MRSTVGFVELRFLLRVHPDSLRKHLAGAAKSPTVLTSDSMFFRIRPKTGWPEGKRYTLSVDIGLTPCGGTLPLDSALSTSFFVSDTLSCLGLFRNGRKVSPQDTLFLEDDYTLEFSHPVMENGFEDYSSVNGRPSRLIWPSGNRLPINRYLTPGRPWTLSLDAGFPSVDSAYLFKSLRFRADRRFEQDRSGIATIDHKECNGPLRKIGFDSRSAALRGNAGRFDAVTHLRMYRRQEDEVPRREKIGQNILLYRRWKGYAGRVWRFDFLSFSMFPPCQRELHAAGKSGVSRRRLSAQKGFQGDLPYREMETKEILPAGHRSMEQIQIVL